MRKFVILVVLGLPVSTASAMSPNYIFATKENKGSVLHQVACCTYQTRDYCSLTNKRGQCTQRQQYQVCVVQCASPPREAAKASGSEASVPKHTSDPVPARKQTSLRRSLERQQKI